ncbi:MAG: hypothetical protein QGF82_01735 [Candidatus Marinimicrobia bacterium]|nr:hypothetical protein [Candidatus Neomarinimicrobiota bacterium]
MFNVGFWIMDGERCLIMDFGFWIMDFQLFFLSSTIYNSTSIISLDMAPPFQSQRRTVKGDV